MAMTRPQRIPLSPTREEYAEIERAADGLPLATWALREVLRAARREHMEPLSGRERTA
jgi:hypothetical protein